MEENTKNNYEQKKQDRERARDLLRANEKMKRKAVSLMRYALWIVLLLVIGYGLFLLAQNAVPDGEDFSVAHSIQGQQHIDVGSSHPSYNSNPPSSGWHYVSPARGGFYNEMLPDEQVIHNLEHGDIWIAYHPGTSEEIRDMLESFAGQYVVVSPRTGNGGDISLVAWGRVDTFSAEDGIVDEGRIRDFIKRYDNRGPEKVRGIQTGHAGF
ncbi:MAG: DUF3105 domain-containing protein [Parcubacteria group bacterium]